MAVSESVRDHEPFVFTGWDEIPWKDNCPDCEAIRHDPLQDIGLVTNHWAKVGMTREPTKQRKGDQRLPRGGHACVQDAVIAEMEESKRVGLERYGSTLMTFNGRSTIQDVAEEVRDLHVYLMQVRMEAEADRETLIKVVEEAFVSEGLIPEDMSYEEIATVAVDRIMGWVAGQWES